MRVVHCKHEAFTVYIGRPGRFGNDNIIGRDGTREEVIEMFRHDAWSSPVLLQEIAKLREDDVLGCHCKPLACHGDVIIEIWKELQGMYK